MQRLYSWWTRKPTKDILQDALAEVKYFEEWEASAFKLDEEYGYDLWYVETDRLSLISEHCVVLYLEYT